MKIDILTPAKIQSILSGLLDKVQIDNSNPAMGPVLSFLGDVKMLEAAVSKVHKRDMAEYSQPRRGW
jgi:hypothetical protein